MARMLDKMSNKIFFYEIVGEYTFYGPYAKRQGWLLKANAKEYEYRFDGTNYLKT